MSKRFKTICVVCGTSSGKNAVLSNEALNLGRESVKRRIHLVYGGGNIGPMSQLAHRVKSGGGHVIGVIPKGAQLTGNTVQVQCTRTTTTDSSRKWLGDVTKRGMLKEAGASDNCALREPIMFVAFHYNSGHSRMCRPAMHIPVDFLGIAQNCGALRTPEDELMKTKVYEVGVNIVGALAEAGVEACRKRLGKQLKAQLISAGVSPSAGNTVGELVTVADIQQGKAERACQADVSISLPGGYGTREELVEVVTWNQLGIHKKPVGLLNVDGSCDNLLAFFDKHLEEEFFDNSARSIYSGLCSYCKQVTRRVGGLHSSCLRAQALLGSGTAMWTGLLYQRGLD